MFRFITLNKKKLNGVLPRHKKSLEALALFCTFLLGITLLFNFGQPTSTDENVIQTNNVTEFKSCKAADIQGKYKTISADYEILDQMFKIVNTSEEYRNAIKDKSTIIEYSNNGKGTYRVHVTSDSLAQPKTKMFRVGTAYQRLVGSTENKNDHTLLVYACDGDNLKKTKSHQNGKVMLQERSLKDEEGKTIVMTYRQDALVATRTLEKITD